MEKKRISPGSYHFRLIALTHSGGCTANGAKMIRPGSYRFRPDPLTPLGGFTRNGEKMISPGSYRFRLIALTHLTRPNSWAKQVREIEWGHLTLDSMTF